MLAMPETPAWLHHAGREQLARAALLRLRPQDQVENEFHALEASTDAAHSRKSGSSTFSSPALRLALVAGVGLALIQQITGINAVMYYAPSIFVAAGFTSSVDAIADDLLLAFLLVIVTFVASRLVDRLGRRSLMLKGTFFLTQDFVNHLRDTKRPGKIINISSVHEELPFPHFSTYCASKGALKMLCRDLAIELAPLGITINNIAPGAIETPINTKQTAQQPGPHEGLACEHSPQPPRQGRRRSRRGRIPGLKRC
jgi:NAD(P)-dependent dehydrogenase (short-subunit alcohol dehydrogenase family)